MLVVYIAMSILKYFKLKNVLPSPEGPLSRDVPSSSIQAANKNIIALFESEAGTTKGGKRGKYEKHFCEEKAIVENYAVLHSY